MKFPRPHWLIYALLVPVALAMIFAWSPAWNALVVGGDEGVELSKALLLSERPAAVSRMENDQPWLYTMLVSAGFQMFGPSAGLTRLFSLVSATAMLAALGRMLFPAVGGLGCLFTGILLFSAKGMLTLSVAALSGLPAVSWAIVSVAIADQPSHPPNWKRLVLSGVIFACAVQIKFTALMILPAFAIFLLRQWQWKSAGRNLCHWTTGFVAAFLVIAIASPAFDFRLLFYSSPKLAAINSGFHLNTLLLNPGLVLAAICGILYMIKRKAPAPLLLASVWFATAAILAGWGFGSEQDIVHLYIPLAMLGAVGFTTTVSSALEVFQENPSESPKNHGWWFCNRNELNALGAVTIFAFWVGFAIPDFVSDLNRLNQLPIVKHDGLCLSIGENARATRWCYTRFPEYAFAGGVMIPPEPVIPAWGARKNKPADSSALEIVKKYQPEQLLLAGNIELRDPAWTAWTTNHYVLVDRDGEKELWVSRLLHPKEIQTSNDLLHKLGL